MRFGWAQRKITPQGGIGLVGYFNVRIQTGVLDDVLVQAFAVADDDTIGVLLNFDLAFVPHDFREAIREACVDIDGLQAGHILFAATHTHTGPEIRLSWEGSSAEFNASVVAAASGALHDAVAKLAPGTLVYGKTSDDRFAFNRRYWMKSGEVVTNPPRKDPDIDRPEGPIDPEIGLLGVKRDGKLAFLMANISNHSDTVGGTEISAGWPGFLRRTVEEQLGPESMVMSITGCEGNINHFDPNGPEVQYGYDVAQRIGEGYAASAIAALSTMTASGSQGLQAAQGTFEALPPEIPEADIEEAREHARKYTFDGETSLTSEDLATKTPAALKYFADHLLMLAEDCSSKLFEVQAMRIGDGVLVSLPGEPFVEIGLAIKQEMLHGQPAIVAILNDDNAAYIPNRFNFGHGGYETTPRCAPYAPDTADRMLAAVKQLVAEVQAGA